MVSALDFLQVGPDYTSTKSFTEPEPCDMHCPSVCSDEMRRNDARLGDPETMNFWRASCLAKTTEPDGVCRRLGCETGNKIRARSGLPPITKQPLPPRIPTVEKLRMSFRQRRAAEIADTGYCHCGEPSMPPKSLLARKERDGLTGPICAECRRRERERIKYRAKADKQKAEMAEFRAWKKGQK